MTKHHSLCHLYLRLFSLLFLPISGNISNYLTFVEEKTLNFIKEEQYLSIFSRTVLKQLKAGDPAWEASVPPQVAKIIKERRLLGYPGNSLTGNSSAAIIAA